MNEKCEAVVHEGFKATVFHPEIAEPVTVTAQAASVGLADVAGEFAKERGGGRMAVGLPSPGNIDDAIRHCIEENIIEMTLPPGSSAHPAARGEGELSVRPYLAAAVDRDLGDPIWKYIAYRLLSRRPEWYKPLLMRSMAVLVSGRRLAPYTTAGTYAMDKKRGAVPWLLAENHRLRLVIQAAINAAWGYPEDHVVRTGPLVAAGLGLPPQDDSAARPMLAVHLPFDSCNEKTNKDTGLEPLAHIGLRVARTLLRKDAAPLGATRGKSAAGPGKRVAIVSPYQDDAQYLEAVVHQGTRPGILSEVGCKPGVGIEDLRRLQLECEGSQRLSEEELDALCVFTGTVSQAIGGTFHTVIVLISRDTRFTREAGLMLVALTRATQSTIIIGNIDQLWQNGGPEVYFFMEFLFRMRMIARADHLMRGRRTRTWDVDSDRLVDYVVDAHAGPAKYDEHADYMYAVDVIKDMWRKPGPERLDWPAVPVANSLPLSAVKVYNELSQGLAEAHPAHRWLVYAFLVVIGHADPRSIGAELLAHALPHMDQKVAWSMLSW